MSSLHDDPRVQRGLHRQLEERRRLIAGGAQPIGWKAGFGTAAAKENLGTSGPLSGYLLDRTRVPDGGTVAVAEWANPLVEVEVAAQLETALAGGASREEAAAAIGALAPAIELVDLHTAPSPDGLEDILAGGIFHRAVVLGAFTRERAGGAIDDVRVTIEAGGEAVGADLDPADGIGDLVEVVRAIADLLDAAGERLSAGDVLITGAVTPPFAGVAGQRVVARFGGGLGEVSVQLA